MQRRFLLALVTLTLLAGAVGAALVTRAPDAVHLSERPGDASHVTLYQNGLAVVRLVRTFESAGGLTSLALALPPTTLYESILVEGDGVSVREVRSALSQTSGIRPGASVAVHVDETIFRGTVQALEGGRIVLATATGLAYVDMAKTTAIEVEGPVAAAPPTPGAVEVHVVVDAPPGARDVTVSYLTQGSGWTPSYRLDTDSGRLVLFATLVAPEDWRGVTLDLVSGEPRVVYRPSDMSYRNVMFEAGASYDAKVEHAQSFGPSVPLGDLHRYRYDGTIDVSRGESLRLPLLEGSADVLRRYHEARAHAGGHGIEGEGQPIAVAERLDLRNPFDDPLPPGVVHLYRDGEWVGQDMVQATPPRERTNVTLSTSMDVKARLTLRDHESTSTTDRWTYDLSVTNRFAGASERTLDLRAVLDHPTYRVNVLSVSDGAARTGGSAAWDRAIEPGQTATFTLSIETLRYG